jgi:hypothetical protein
MVAGTTSAIWSVSAPLPESAARSKSAGTNFFSLQPGAYCPGFFIPRKPRNKLQLRTKRELCGDEWV